MALIVGTNSYVSVAEADAYFQDRVHQTAWDNASPQTNQEEALTTATSLLDLEPWAGITAVDGQALAWPRTGVVSGSTSGRNIILGSLGTGAPDAVKIGCYELALHLINNTDLLEDTGETDSLKVGTISLVSIRKASVIPRFVKRFYQHLLVGGGSRRVF